MDTLRVAQMGCTRGLRCHGCGDAQAERGDEGSFGLGIEVEGAMREMLKLVDEAESDL